jgi:hypothetical protein
MNYTLALKWTYDGYNMARKRWPKAAKKSRVRKKWIKRYGSPDVLKNMVYATNPFLSLTPKGESLSGYFCQPIVFGSK